MTEELGVRSLVIPHRALSRLAAVAMVASLIFIIVGDEPVAADFFGTGDEALRLQVLLDAADEWDRLNTAWAIAGLVAAVGFVLWALAIRFGRADHMVNRVSMLGAVSASVGALSWVSVCVWRATAPPADVAAGLQSGLLTLAILAWGLLVMVAVGTVGWTLLRGGMRVRGWLVIALAVIFVPIGTFLPATAVFPVTLTGVVLLVTPPSR